MRKHLYDENGRLWCIVVEDPWREILRTSSIPSSTLYWSEEGRHFRLPKEGDEDCP